MNGPGRVLVAKHFDRPFRAAPMAEMDEIAGQTTAVSADRRFGLRVIAETHHEIGRFGPCLAI